MRKRTIDEQEIKALIEARELTQKEVAEVLGVTSSAVMNWEKRLGIKCVKKNHSYKRISIDKDKVIELRKAGWTDTNIAHKLGVSQSQISVFKKEHGIII